MQSLRSFFVLAFLLMASTGRALVLPETTTMPASEPQALDPRGNFTLLISGEPLPLESDSTIEAAPVAVPEASSYAFFGLSLLGWIVIFRHWKNRKSLPPEPA